MTATDELPKRLMTNGCINAARVNRGMLIVDSAGRDIGFIAGVVVDSTSESATHLLLGHLPPTGDYRLASVDRITGITTDRVSTSLSPDEWSVLPRHEPE